MDNPQTDRATMLVLSQPAATDTSANVSSFRLYLHVQTGSADGELRRWRDTLGVVPEWVKLFARIHCSEVKAVDARIKTLLRYQEMSEDDRYLASREAGRRFVRDAKARAGGTFRDVDALEFVNEKTDYNNFAQLVRLNEAALGFVEQCVAEGVKPALPCNAFANPMRGLMLYLAPCIRAAIAAGGYYAPHCYGPMALFDRAGWYVECYAQQLEELAAAGVIVPPERVLISEFGNDDVSDPNYPGRSGPVRDLIGHGLTWDIVKNTFMEYAARLALRRIGGAFMYNCFGYPGDKYELFPELREWYGEQLAAHVSPSPLPAPTWPRMATVTATGGLRVRTEPGGTVFIGNMPHGSRVEVLGVSAAGWARLALDAGGVRLAPGASDPDPTAYCAAEFLDFDS